MNLYVGNLSWGITEEELQQVFENYGEVTSCRIVVDRETNRSRGFAFVDMPNDDEANAAISALEGYDFKGRNMSVKEARPREERSQGGGGGGYRSQGGGGGGRKNFGGGGGESGGYRNRY